MATLVLKNYRCFPDSHPVRIELTPGLTAFLGANNSGKTSLIRLFAELSPHLSWMVTPHGQPISPAFHGAETSPRDARDLSHDRNDRPLSVDISSEGVSLSLVFGSGRRARISVAMGGNQVILADGEGIQKRQDVEAILGRYPQLGFVNQIARSLFVPAFRTPFSSDATNRQTSVPMGSSFIREWDQRKRGTDKVGNRLIQRVTNDVAHLMGLSSLAIDSTPDNHGMTLVLNGNPYQLHEIGAGLSHCLMTLFYAAVARPTYICIDEPETGLHPSLQVDFLNALNSYATSGLWMATHNVGLARSVANTIYVAKRRPHHSELVMWEDTPRLSAVLGELSFGSYAALGGATILLVEGPNEVRCYQQWLRLYGLDQRVIILPLGGSQMINGTRDLELAEVLRITPNVAAVIDRETEAADAKVERERLQFAASCNHLRIRCHVLERRATENYLTERAAKIASEEYAVLLPYEKPGGSRWWGKSNNWRVAREMTIEEIDSTDLGQFLRSLGQ